MGIDQHPLLHFFGEKRPTIPGLFARPWVRPRSEDSGFGVSCRIWPSSLMTICSRRQTSCEMSLVVWLGPEKPLEKSLFHLGWLDITLDTMGVTGFEIILVSLSWRPSYFFGYPFCKIHQSAEFSRVNGGVSASKWDDFSLCCLMISPNCWLRC